MPIYEFYCSECHTVYSFLSKRVDTETHPHCPHCNKAKLTRKISLFAVSKGMKAGDEASLPDIDEAKLEKVMGSLAGDAENLNEDDPKQVAQLMRRFYDAAGLGTGPGIEEAISRMEAGEAPDQIEKDLGDILDGEDPFAIHHKKKSLRKIVPPAIDDTLYEM